MTTYHPETVAEVANAIDKALPMRVILAPWQLEDLALAALAAATGTAKTAKRVECEASQSGGSARERNAQTLSSTPDNKDKPNA